MDSIIATYPWGGQVLSGNLQYTIDIVNHSMKVSENQNQIPNITHECVLFDTVAVLVPRSYNEMDTLKCLYYILLNEPFTIRFAKLPIELTKNVAYVFLALKTAKNTLCIVGCDANKSKTIMAELFMNMHDDNNLHISYRTIPLEFNNSSMIYGTTIGRYTFVNINNTDIYYSEDIDNWQLGYSIDGNSIVEMVSNQNSLKVFYNKEDIKCDILNISIIDSYDVPMHKSFLNSNGELIKGQVGYSQYALFSSGKVCNMEVNDHVLFDNRLIFDPRENMNSICQIIFFNDAYYFLLGYKKHYVLFESSDGQNWRIVHELTNNKLPTTNGNYNRWKMIIIDGELCLVKVGTSYDVNYCMRFDMTESVVSQVFDSSIIWKYENTLDEIAYGNLTYLYHACNGVMCGYGVNPNIFTKIMVVNNYGYTVICDTEFRFNHIIEISNKDDAVLLVSDNGTMYLEDEKVYYTTNINFSQTDMSTFRIYVYENYFITVEKSYWGTPFIHFYRREETINVSYESEDGVREYPTIIEIPISSLPSELTLFYKRSYLPKVYIKDNPYRKRVFSFRFLEC